VGKLSDIYHLEDLGIQGGVLLKLVSRRYYMGFAGFDWIRK
jgi:hypothetical protein